MLLTNVLRPVLLLGGSSYGGRVRLCQTCLLLYYQECVVQGSKQEFSCASALRVSSSQDEQSIIASGRRLLSWCMREWSCPDRSPAPPLVPVISKEILLFPGPGCFFPPIFVFVPLFVISPKNNCKIRVVPHTRVPRTTVVHFFPRRTRSQCCRPSGSTGPHPRGGRRHPRTMGKKGKKKAKEEVQEAAKYDHPTIQPSRIDHREIQATIKLVGFPFLTRLQDCHVRERKHSQLLQGYFSSHSSFHPA